jgi:uncharacterized protein (DUF1697 family)
MYELKTCLEDLGLQDVRTVIQSGNVIFQTESQDNAGLVASMRAAILQKHGIELQVWLLTPDALRQVLANNPFPQAQTDPKSLHIFFLVSDPLHPHLEELGSLRKENERFELHDSVVYLHAPDGIGRSKLVNALEKQLDVPITGRNWRSLNRILTAAQEAQ